MELIDSHSHIDFTAFDHDRSTVITRANNANISHIIVSSTTAKRWPLVTDVVKINNKHAKNYHGGNLKSVICHAAYGLHPMFMDEHKCQNKNNDLDKLNTYLTNNNAVAVGEIGLDFFIPSGSSEQNKNEQISLFFQQLEMANNFNLPVIIHARKSLDIILKYLRLFPNLSGSIHSFSGSQQQAKQLIDLGFYLSFGGPITYTRATRLQSLVKALPLESMLIETDAPDQPDSTHYQQRNEPAFLPIIAKTIAEIRGIDVHQVATITTNNAKTLFKL